jgi:hypothetical protein
MSDASLSRHTALLNCDTVSTKVVDWKTRGHPEVPVVEINVSIICIHYFNTVASMQH